MCSFIWCPSLTLISVFSREKYWMWPILQQGCTMRLIPRIAGRLLKFGILWQKPKIDWLKSFDLRVLRNSSPSLTRITAKISFMRCLPYVFLSFLLSSLFCSSCTLCIFSYITLFYFAYWLSFSHLPCYEYDNQTLKDGNYTCGCLLQG